jgi:hypothetical protein
MPNTERMGSRLNDLIYMVAWGIRKDFRKKGTNTNWYFQLGSRPTHHPNWKKINKKIITKFYCRLLILGIETYFVYNQVFFLS